MIRHTTAILITAAALAAVVFADPAQAQRRQSMSDRMGALEQRMFELENAPSDDVESRQATADIVMSINEMRQEIRDLRGLLEDQSFEIEQIKSAQQDQYLDLDRRVSTLTEHALGGSVTTRPTGLPGGPAGGPMDPTADVLFGPQTRTGELPEVRDPIDAQLETTVLTAGGTQEISEIIDPQAEKNDYDAAFQALKEGRYAESARLFAAFVERFPNGEYADNAQYWLGESYYVTGNYRIALDAFQKLVGRFPDSSKVPDAKLKLGFTHYELKQWEAAETMLAEVTREYPNTTVSRLAENRLRAMNIEGHVQ